ncbi:MAG: efflux RND transporter periplasmic adaptor subunit [Holosporales bacterium]|jgi:HlyD family secretion protein|nr:efflux RND transporter periplasmic adaptor subunit [Holosporales bacterium]
MAVNKKVFGALLAIIVVGTTIFAYSNINSSKKGEITLNGNVEIREIKVTFRGSGGRIKNINVDEGSNIQKGDILAILETDILGTQVQLAKADLLESEVNLKNAKKDFDRVASLYRKSSISEKIYDDVKNKFEMAEARNKAARAKFEMANINLNDAVIISPVDGIVITRSIEIGEMISPGITAFSIMPNEKTRIRTYGNNEVITRIKHNDKVKVSVDSLKNKNFNGHIAFISSEPEFTPRNIETKELRSSLVYKIRIILDDSNTFELKPGMPVTVKFDNATKSKK